MSVYVKVDDSKKKMAVGPVGPQEITGPLTIKGNNIKLLKLDRTGLTGVDQVGVVGIGLYGDIQ